MGSKYNLNYNSPLYVGMGKLFLASCTTFLVQKYVKSLVINLSTVYVMNRFTFC